MGQWHEIGSWVIDIGTNLRKQPQVFYKKAIPKKLAIFTGKCFSACNFIKNRLQHRCFSVNIATFSRAPISKNICERLFLNWIKNVLTFPFRIENMSSPNYEFNTKSQKISIKYYYVAETFPRTVKQFTWESLVQSDRTKVNMISSCKNIKQKWTRPTDAYF